MLLSVSSTLVFLLFSGDEWGEDLIEEARFAGLAVAVRVRFDFRPFELVCELPSGFVFEELEVLRLRSGSSAFLFVSSSSSDKTMVDLRGRFVGRGFDDMPAVRFHVGSGSHSKSGISRVFRTGWQTIHLIDAVTVGR